MYLLCCVEEAQQHKNLLAFSIKHDISAFTRKGEEYCILHFINKTNYDYHSNALSTLRNRIVIILKHDIILQ